MKTIVVGGAGFIGSHLTKQLVEDGKDVVVVDDLSTGKMDNLEGLDLEFVQLDITSDDEIWHYLYRMKVDTVYNLATRNIRESLSNPYPSNKVNTIGTLNLLEWAKDMSFRFVYISSSEVYGSHPKEIKESDYLKPTTIYGASKLAGEFYTKVYRALHGVEAVIVRPFNTFGPNCQLYGTGGEVIPRFVHFALEESPFTIYGAGLQTRDFTYVKDIARGIKFIGEFEDPHFAGPVNISSGYNLSILVLINKIASLTGLEVEQVHHNFFNTRAGEVSNLHANCDFLKSLGFEFKFSFEDGLKEYIEWHKSLPASSKRVGSLNYTF